MFSEKYQSLSDSEKEKFTRLINLLLNKTFLTREIYENKSKIGKSNLDYRYIERYFDLFEDFLLMAGYRLEKDDTFGVIHIYNIYELNKAHMDKFTTLMLFTLRLIYEEEKQKNASSISVFCSLSDVIVKMMELKLVTKKPTIKDSVEAIRYIAKFNVISKLDGAYEDFTASIAILPTILWVVSNEKINAIHSMIFAEDKENEVSEIDFEIN